MLSVPFSFTFLLVYPLFLWCFFWWCQDSPCIALLYIFSILGISLLPSESILDFCLQYYQFLPPSGRHYFLSLLFHFYGGLSLVCWSGVFLFISSRWRPSLLDLCFEANDFFSSLSDILTIQTTINYPGPSHCVWYQLWFFVCLFWYMLLIFPLDSTVPVLEGNGVEGGCALGWWVGVTASLPVAVVVAKTYLLLPQPST